MGHWGQIIQMKNHVKIFTNFWNSDDIIMQTYQCFMCNSWEGTDIHHISSRGMGGSRLKDYLENLTCLCRRCHDRCHQDKDFNIRARITNLRNIADKLESEIDG